MQEEGGAGDFLVREVRSLRWAKYNLCVEDMDGRWVGLEVKLGQSRIDEGARNLLGMREKLAQEEAALCGALVVVSADTPTYQRPDEVLVTSLAAMGP